MGQPSASAGAVGALSGVRVLDLSRMIAAPFAAMCLGEMGAEVIKIERAGVGDDARFFGPFDENGESPYYAAFNRNKRSVALDLSSPAGVAVVRRLILEWADVVIENFKDGTLERWNLALEDLRREKPSLVTASLRGYPEGDPRPGYDFVIQAASGLMSMTGEPEGDPMRVGIPISDITAGHFLLSGILAALFERQRSGLGQHISVSLYEAQAAVMSCAAQQYLSLGLVPIRVGNGNTSAGPYGVYPTATSPVAVCCGAQRQFEELARELGRLDWLEDERFSSNQKRVENRVELDRQLTELLSTRSREEVIELMHRAGVPAGPVQTLPEMLDHDPASFRMVRKVPTVDGKEMPVVALPWQFSRTPAEPRSAVRRLGEDTEEVLESLGISLTLGDSNQ